MHADSRWMGLPSHFLLIGSSVCLPYIAFPCCPLTDPFNTHVGDATNLIGKLFPPYSRSKLSLSAPFLKFLSLRSTGCVLTDQLPFQTMVATYFCFVDLCLLGQYIYYSRIQLAAHSLESPPDESPFTTPTGSIATITSASRRRRRSVSEISQLSTLHQISVAAAANAGLHSRDIEVVQMDSPTSYHHPRSLSQSTVLRIHPQEYDEQYAGSRVTSPVSPTSPSTASTDATTDHHFPAQQNSTGHGETEARSRTSGTSAQRNKRNVSWDPEFTTLSRRYGTASRDTKADSVPRHREPLPQTSAEEFWSGILPPPQPQPEVDLERGRRRARELHNLSLQVRPVQKTAVGPASDEEAQLSEIEPLAHYPPAPRRSQSPIASVRRKSKYRATAPMVLFSIWLLVSFGGSSTQGSGSLQRPRSPPGAVLRRSPPLYPIPQDSPTPSSFSSNFPTPSFSLLSSSESSTFAVSELKINYDHPKEQFRDPEPQVRRIIGRVSAWICTTLYLTSRLPQIWKNVRARSNPFSNIVQLTRPPFTMNCSIRASRWKDSPCRFLFARSWATVFTSPR